MQENAEIKQVANDLVTLLSTEIRAMDKEMRCFSSEMLIKINSHVPSATVVQMMQKESMFEQKFVQIGLLGSQMTSKTKQAAGLDSSALVAQN